MAECLVGVSAKREFYVEEAGSPSTGATLTYTLTGPTGTSLVSAASATEDSGGWYYYQLSGTTHLSAPGWYREVWSGTTSGGKTLRRDGGFLCLYADGPLVTWLELRHQIAQLIDDLQVGQAVTGTSTTLTDTALGQDTTSQSGNWRGKYLYLSGGTGRGQERLVSASASGGVLTVAKAWSTLPDNTSLYELHGRPVADYLRAVNLAIEQAAPRALLPLVDETVSETTNTWEYTVPAGFHYLVDVWHRDTSSSTNDWQRLDRRKGEWAIIPGRRILRLKSPTTGWALRLVGQYQPDLLQQDSSFTPLSAAYLAYRSAAHLLSSKILSPQVDRQAFQARATLFHQEAEALKPSGVPLSNAVRL